MDYKVEYFARREFLCPCCGRGEVAGPLVLWLDLLRRAWSGPVIVNSGWRCEAHNLEVGGSKASRHLIGCAADIRAQIGVGRFSDWAEFSALVARLCRLPGWEFRLYGTFVHVAVPRDTASRTWNGGPIQVAA